MLIESVPIVAVPVNFSAHEVSPGPVAFASALQLMLVGDIRTPCAVPVYFRSPGHVALNDPFADVAVCSVTVHLKSVQVLGVGISCDEVQLPRSELLPATLGSLRELLCSKPAQPDAAAAASDNTITRNLFLMCSSRQSYRAHGARRTVVGEAGIITPQIARHRAQRYAGSDLDFPFFAKRLTVPSYRIAFGFAKNGKSRSDPIMSILKIARMGHPVLRAKTRPVHPSEIRSPKIQQLVDDMFETMREYQGVGLAAPQVHEGVRVFVAGFPPRPGRDDEDEEDDEEGEH